MKKIIISIALCLLFLSTGKVFADTGVDITAYSRLTKVYNHSYYSKNTSYGYHGTDYKINGELEVYAEIRVEGQTTKRNYGIRNASVRAAKAAYQNINHSHAAGGS